MLCKADTTTGRGEHPQPTESDGLCLPVHDIRGASGPLMSTLTNFITKDVDETYDLYYAMFGQRARAEVTELIKGFPSDTTTLFEKCSISLQHSTTKPMKMQTRLTTAVMVHERDQLRDHCDDNLHEPSAGTSDIDQAHVSLSLRRSQQSHILNASVCYQSNRVPAEEFIFLWRYYLNLRRLIRKGRPKQALVVGPAADLVTVQGNNVGFVVEVCSLRHGQTCTLWTNGTHEISCPSTFSVRSRAHNMITRVCAAMSEEVGCVARIEPKTREVLLDDYTESEVRGLMPKVLTKANKVRMNELASVFTALSSTPSTTREQLY